MASVPEVGSCYASKMLVINVLNVNDPPTFPGNYHGAKISANEDETWTKDSMQGPISIHLDLQVSPKV